MKKSYLIKHWANLFESENQILDLSNTKSELFKKLNIDSYYKEKTYTELKKYIKNSNLKRNWDNVIKNPKYYQTFDSVPLIDVLIADRKANRYEDYNPSRYYEELIGFWLEVLDGDKIDEPCNLLDVLLLLDYDYGNEIAICVNDSDSNQNYNYTDRRDFEDLSKVQGWAESIKKAEQKPKRIASFLDLIDFPNLKDAEEIKNLINKAFSLPTNYSREQLINSENKNIVVTIYDMALNVEDAESEYDYDEENY